MQCSSLLFLRIPKWIASCNPLWYSHGTVSCMIKLISRDASFSQKGEIYGKVRRKNCPHYWWHERYWQGHGGAVCERRRVRLHHRTPRSGVGCGGKGNRKQCDRCTRRCVEPWRS